MQMRELAEQDFADYADLVISAFLSADSAADAEVRMRVILGDSRRVGVFDGDRLVGAAAVGPREITLPGAVMVPFEAVTFVAVAADQRRRGVLTTLIRSQLQQIHDAGGPAIAALWASEAGIYQRFGFGQASEQVLYAIRGKAPFRKDIDLGGDRVRELGAADALPAIRALYDEYAPQRAGSLSRADWVWQDWLHDPVDQRRGWSARRWAVHPRGYLIYRVKPAYADNVPSSTLMVEELVALTPQANAALLRYAIDMDLVTEVTYTGSMDDPLPMMLADSRTAVGKVQDALYIRLVDADRALAQRRYSAAVDVVIEVADDLCPWNAGRVRLAVDSAGVPTVTRTDDPADLVATSTELGAVYLGGTRLTRLVDAGRVVERTPGAAAALSVALSAEREPRCLEVF
ncbi:GNAT family N-acetyltransferase [Actinokineospora sp. NPDC004072]